MARVLIIGENREDYFLLAQLVLQRQEHTCLTATTEAEALHHLQHSNIDILFIVDPRRLDFDGWAFYQSLKADPNLAIIPVIVYKAWAYSGSPNPVDYGDTLFIRPLDFDDLIEKVEELSGRGKGGE